MPGKANNVIRGRLIRSYMLSVVTISLVLLLAGVLACIGVNARSVSDYFKKSVPVAVILRNNVEEAEAHELSKRLGALDFVTESVFISREEGERQMKELLGEDFLNVFEASPIPVSIELRVQPEYVCADSIAVIRERIERMEGVSEVSCQESLVDALNANLRRAGLVVMAIVAVLLLISSVLIGNTVRLNIFDKRFTVNTMRLVGATKAFIRRPFVRKSFWQGLVAGLLADGLLVLVLWRVWQEFPQLVAILDRRMIETVLGSLLVLGIMICIFSTIRAVNRMVSLKRDELYY